MSGWMRPAGSPALARIEADGRHYQDRKVVLPELQRLSADIAEITRRLKATVAA